MLPTFNEAGDIVVVDCLHVKLGKPLQKGDIVIAKSPTNPGNTVCKRVLGLVRASDSRSLVIDRVVPCCGMSWHVCWCVGSAFLTVRLPSSPHTTCMHA